MPQPADRRGSIRDATRDGAARRDPRVGEISLMLTLLDGPRPVASGPIGRCVKQGWCQALLIDSPRRPTGGVRVLYALTDTGRALLRKP